MTSINRAPTGWLGFLGIKNFGRNPAAASDVLAPTWDLSELYLTANRTYVAAFPSLTATGMFRFGSVPPGQVWYMQGYSVISNTLAVGNTLQFQIALEQVATGTIVALPGSGPAAAVTAGNNAIAALPRPIFLHPGESLGVYVTQFAGAAIPCLGNFVYTRLDA